MPCSACRRRRRGHHDGAQITCYEHDGYRGNVFTPDKAERNLFNRGFNDRASSVAVERGRWEVCENESHGGSCRVLRGVGYDSLRALGRPHIVGAAHERADLLTWATASAACIKRCNDPLLTCGSDSSRTRLAEPMAAWDLTARVDAADGKAAQAERHLWLARRWSGCVRGG